MLGTALGLGVGSPGWALGDTDWGVRATPGVGDTDAHTVSIAAFPGMATELQLQGRKRRRSVRPAEGRSRRVRCLLGTALPHASPHPLAQVALPRTPGTRHHPSLLFQNQGLSCSLSVGPAGFGG